MDKKLLKQLELLDFPPKQARTYLAILMLGTANITTIAKTAELKRPTTYLMIEELMKKILFPAFQKEKSTTILQMIPKSLLTDK